MMASAAFPEPEAASLPKSGDGTVNDSRIDFAREVVAGSQAIDGSAAEVLDDDVGLFQQVGEHGLGFRVL